MKNLGYRKEIVLFVLVTRLCPKTAQLSKLPRTSWVAPRPLRCIFYREPNNSAEGETGVDLDDLDYLKAESNQEKKNEILRTRPMTKRKKIRR